jgi:Zn finger protein HypA/HybF involved in hydrogenase expression
LPWRSVPPTGVDPEALRFCCDVVVEETMARGADLVIQRTPHSHTRCRSCYAEFELTTRLAPAPRLTEQERAGEGTGIRVLSSDGE